METDCNKCVYRKLLTSGRCVYEHTKKGDFCGAFKKTPYHLKKERETENAKRLYELVSKNGITPKYKIGDEVYIIGCVKNIEKTKIREIVVSEDGLSFRYKVKGHTEYTYTEDEIYPSEAECLRAIIENFIESTKREAEFLKKYAGKVGLPLDEIKLLLQ